MGWSDALSFVPPLPGVWIKTLLSWNNNRCLGYQINMFFRHSDINKWIVKWIYHHVKWIYYHVKWIYHYHCEMDFSHMIRFFLFCIWLLFARAFPNNKILDDWLLYLLDTRLSSGTLKVPHWHSSSKTSSSPVICQNCKLYYSKVQIVFVRIVRMKKKTVFRKHSNPLFCNHNQKSVCLENTLYLTKNEKKKSIWKIFSFHKRFSKLQ